MGLLEPHARYRGQDGELPLRPMAGRLSGIATRAAPRAPMEVHEHKSVTRDAGVTGDHRGALAARKGYFRRQVSLIEAESWQAALDELGAELPWQMRRANLLIEGVRLPRAAGARVFIGDACELRITGECDPCFRMEEILPGLEAALTPDWRGGFVAEVVRDGDVRIGDGIRIEL